MAEHLPECFMPKDDWPCICDRLRACEARHRHDVLNEWKRDPHALMLSRAQIMALGDLNRDEGYARGLDDARDAVDGLHSRFETDQSADAIDAAVSAIDALKGASDGRSD